MPLIKPAQKQSGFTLLEVLIALLVLAIGLLGMASLMMTSLQSNQSAYLRSQASMAANDFAERLRANRNTAIGTNPPYILSLTPSSTAPTDPGCKTATGGCTAADQARLDVFEWWAYLQASVPGASAVVVRDNTNRNEYQISINWQESDAQQQRATATSTVSRSMTVRVNL